MGKHHQDRRDVPAPAPEANARPPEPDRRVHTEADEIEVIARSDLWHKGGQVRAGERVRLPRAEYERDRRCWASLEDQQEQEQQIAQAAAEQRAHQDDFWQRVRIAGEQRQRADLKRAQVAEEQAERQRELAARGRAAAEDAARAS